jgi:Domain of unknown function (DUF1707)
MTDEARPPVPGTEAAAPGGDAAAGQTPGGEAAAGQTPGGEAAAGGGEAAARGGDLRASHDDRDRVVDLLRVAAGDGRLTAEELDERVEAALTARTYSELTALVSDLPAAGAAAVGVPDAKPKDVVRIDCDSSNTNRDGRWMVPRRMEMRVTSGSVTLDFTEAVVSWPTLQIDAEIRSGNLTLVTKPGVIVNTDDLTIRSSNVKTRASWGPDVPVMLRIDMSGRVESSNINVRPPRPPRRTFWQWLLRRPRPALPPAPPARPGLPGLPGLPGPPGRP